MKHVSILVPEGTASIAVTGPMDVLSEAGNYYMQQKSSVSRPFFKIELVSQDQINVRCLNDYVLSCHRIISEVEKTDLILVPNLSGNLEDHIQRNRGLIDWMKTQYEQGVDIGAFCTGTFLLAATGLLNDRIATTHWMAVKSFKELFPEVKLLSDKIITDEGRLVCAGGSTSFFNLVLYLIERYCGHEVAVWVSKSMLIDMDKAPQTTYAIFNTQKNHDDNNILKTQNYIEENISSKISIEELVKITPYSRRSFIRKFKKATGNTPQEYIHRVKIESARRTLEFKDDTVQEISFGLGYNDPGSFSNIFKKYIGITPRRYRKKFRRRT